MPAPTGPPEPFPGSPLSLLAGHTAGRPARRPVPAEPPAPRPLPIAAVLLATGLLFAVSLTSTRRSAPELSRQRTAVEAQIAARTREVDGLVAARARLRQQIIAARGVAATADVQGRAAAALVARLDPSTGAADVVGPGVTVRLANPRGSGGAHLITDRDLAQVVNVLWGHGGEAVAVNGVRLTARSAIRSAGDAILVSFRPLSPPYTVAAIGSSDALAAGFANSAVAARLQTAAAVYGGSVSVTSVDHVQLAAGSGLSIAVAKPGSSPSVGTGAS
jgi:uncharacterized protein YlxW (UPF0749 family)